MTRGFYFLAGSAALVLVLGCFGDYPSGGVSGKQASGTAAAPSPGPKAAQPATTPVPTPQPPVAGHPPSQPSPPQPYPPTPARPPAIAPGQSPARMPAGYPSSPTGPASTAGREAVAIDLSVGLSLPQTGPEGTMMGFSVDYQFSQGQPQPSETFFWVIERAKGPPVKIAVKLKLKDNLSIMVVRGWRPEQGPFQTHIEDSSGRPVSETALLPPMGGF